MWPSMICTVVLFCVLWFCVEGRIDQHDLMGHQPKRWNITYQGSVYGMLSNRGGPREGSGITRSNIREDHHVIYGSGWALGRDTLEYFRKYAALQPYHTFLDCGCGTGRNGIRIAQVLHRNRYYGFDRDPVAIETFRNYEIPLNNLEDKNISLNVNDRFDTGWPMIKFDRILAYSVINHVSRAREAICHMAHALKDNGVLVITHQKWEQHAEACGLNMSQCSNVPSMFYNFPRLYCQYKKVAQAYLSRFFPEFSSVFKTKKRQHGNHCGAIGVEIETQEISVFGV